MNVTVNVESWSDGAACAWDDYAAHCAGACVFHSPGWIRTLRSTYGVKPFLVSLVRNGQYVGGVPVSLVRSALLGTRWVSLPFSDHCQPLYEQEGCQPAIAEHFAAQRVRAQLRGDYGDSLGTVARHAGYVHTTDLSKGIVALRNSFSKTSVRQRLAKAERDPDLAVETSADIASLRVFFGLHLQTRRRQRGLVQPWNYFARLYQCLFAEGQGLVVIARYKGKAVAGGVFLHAYGTMTYKHSASLPQYWKLAPNHLVIWRGMEIGTTLGMRRFDWGRTGMYGDSLRSFKLAWRPTEKSLYYYETGRPQHLRVRVAIGLRNAVGKLEPSLPCSFTKAAGAMLYPQYP